MLFQKVGGEPGLAKKTMMVLMIAQAAIMMIKPTTTLPIFFMASLTFPGSPPVKYILMPFMAMIITAPRNARPMIKFRVAWSVAKSWQKLHKALSGPETVH